MDQFTVTVEVAGALVQPLSVAMKVYVYVPAGNNWFNCMMPVPDPPAGVGFDIVLDQPMVAVDGFEIAFRSNTWPAHIVAITGVTWMVGDGSMVMVAFTRLVHNPLAV